MTNPKGMIRLSSTLLNRSGVTIQGKKTVLLCASLFYFRIPRAEWEDRILKLKAAGYNCADVYFPWNFHETAPDRWSFAGEKDAGAFLTLLQKHQMYVIARPGPYICSEWDGGALPAWVLADPEIKIRENDPKYLAAVQKWYDHILPILAAHQIDCGGTVILMQIENELDFFDCSNPRAYMEALRNMAWQAGMTVPLFGCAGQANVEGATGWADGVDVSFNFYGDECDPTFSEKFHYYAKRLEAQNKPLLVSETSCDHLLLRRELAAGAKLLGPYNQVSGTNFGFTGSMNNWGERKEPHSFIPTYYSGDSMIGPAGELRTQYFEGRSFAGLLHTFGEALAGAESVEDIEMAISSSFPTNTIFYRLALLGGGSLVCVPNLGERDGTAEIYLGGVQGKAIICAHDAPFFPVEVPLSLFGGAGTLRFADGELENAELRNGRLYLTFWTESPTPFAELELDGRRVFLTREDSDTDAVSAVFVSKRVLRKIKLSGVEVPKHRSETPIVQAGTLKRYSIGKDLLKNLPYQAVKTQPLERLGVYRGMGSYHFETSGMGILLLGGSDIVSVRRNGFVDAYARAGAARYFAGSGRWEVLTIIWGHSNFSDARLPGLMLDSAKGICAAVDVNAVQKLESNWFFSYYEGSLPNSLRVPQRAVETMVSINSWNTTRTPLRAIYRKTVTLCSGCDRFFLQIKDACAETVVYADGKRVGLVNPLDPFLDLSALLQGKTTAELELCVTKRDWNEPVGIPILYSGRQISECGFAPLPEEKLTQLVQTAPTQEDSELPLNLEIGTMVALRLPLDSVPQESLYLNLGGNNIFAAVWADKKLLGRVLDWKESPRMCGNANWVYLPKSYRKDAQSLYLLVTALGTDAQLNQVALEKPEL